MDSTQQGIRQKFAAESRGTLPMEGKPAEGGSSFEIMAITAGEGNGWHFSAEALMSAVPLFDQAQCFIDHDDIENPGGHSVRDLAGVLTEPVWDEALKGIRCKLVPMGPASELLSEMGRQILTAETANANVGFSADLSFTYEGKNVAEILRIYSVDLVVDPARGGIFMRALNSIQNRRQTATLTGQLMNDYKAVHTLMDTNDRLAALTQETAKARMLRAEMCKHLLDTALSGAKLPLPVTDRIRKQFSNRVFEPAELTEAIEDGRAMVSALMGGESVAGISGRVNSMYNNQDQINAAVHDLLNAQRPDNLRSLKTQKLSGIRELYTMMTGDYDFHGGYDSTRAHFSTTTDLPGILKNALNKLVAQRWDELGSSGYRWWEPVVTVEHFNNLQAITGILVGEISLLPSVTEGNPYTELGVSDSAETGAWTKYGGYLGLTIEMFERDDTLRLRQFPIKLATAGLRRLSGLIGAVFTGDSGTGPAMADTYHVFDATHHNNLSTVELSGTAWEAASQAIYDQTMLVDGGGTSPKLAIDARYLVVPRKLRLTAQRILYPSLAWEADYTSENMQRGHFGDVITCPELSDATDWAAVADPALAPAIYVGERFGLMPEIYIADNQLTGALFTHDEVRIKARHFLSVFVADYRPLYKANVADA
ncbi:MAG: hypothetical protein AB9907_17575 [Flexilinea sp.]